jgi:glycosyltransferase involved in cell wall biosynthesis
MTDDRESSRTQSQPLVSVLVPAYKHERYVIECLESIKALDYPNLELILSDDVSPDATYDLAAKWVRENQGRFVRAIAIRQPVNLGVVKNLQFLFEQAEGNYFAYIASDDVFTTNAIVARLPVLLNSDDLDAVIGNSQLISETGAILEDRRVPPHIGRVFGDPAAMLRGLIRYWSVVCSSAVIRRKALLEGGSVGRLPANIRFEDRFIFIRLAAQGKLGYVDSVIAKYRSTEGSLSRARTLHSAGVAAVLECDRSNRDLLRGLNRVLLGLNIRSCQVILSAGNRPLYYLKQGMLRMCFLTIWALSAVFRPSRPC